jgi:hypothetical protein
VTINAKQLTGITVLIVSILAGHFGHAQQQPCSPEEARLAESEADTLRSWDAVYRSYKLYRQCDDGAIGEGYSESVARILVDHWNTLPRLASLTDKDPEFRRFVLDHVDATLDVNDAKKISAKARTQCPTGLRSLCDNLRKQADFGLNDAASP